MKIRLFEFQGDALNHLRTKVKEARSFASIDSPQSISFAAPTGAGKTIMMTALFEDIFWGGPNFEAQSDAIILWISDMPELNEQTRLKIESKSDRIRVRQLVKIDANFDAERLKFGHIYFMNIQKLGSDKLLTRKGDRRQYTIWETLSNTAAASADRFYVVIDEAHRGMRAGREAKKARTILQRFIFGSPEDGLCRMPLVIGISATPHRFEELLSGTTHTLHKVYIRGEDVRDSGLVKDRILIHFPNSPGQSELTLLTTAVKRWQDLTERWLSYCSNQDELTVQPILIIQVEDRTKNQLTKTDLRATLTTLEFALGRRLRKGEIAHTFHEIMDFDLNGVQIRRIEPSRIEESRSIGIVLFKMSLSTGWDCPRAEVMMSFRSAQDHTYIAQLLGRMVRTPLVRRIISDSSLNDVHLFLPHFNQATVDSVVQDLKNVEDVPPSETGTNKELLILNRRNGLESVFEAIRKLTTYRVNAVRKQRPLYRLMGLARALTNDRIDELALESVKFKILEKMSEEVIRLQDLGIFEEKVEQIIGVKLKTLAVIDGVKNYSDHSHYTVEVVAADIDRNFQQAKSLLSNGLHTEYWKIHSTRTTEEVKLEVIVLAQEHDAMKNLEQFADREFDSLFDSKKLEIAKLKEGRKQHYEKLRLASGRPQKQSWELPDSIDYRCAPTAVEYKSHLFLDDQGKFRADLGSWEQEVINEELNDPSVIGWFRNVERKRWSFEIPYRESGKVKSMYPDFIVVRQVSTGFAFDILEPHNPSLNDNAVKAIGLAEFAEDHWELFDRIQLIRKDRDAVGKERFFRLDFGKQAVRKKVKSISDNSQLDQIFDEMANPKNIRAPKTDVI